VCSCNGYHVILPVGFWHKPSEREESPQMGERRNCSALSPRGLLHLKVRNDAVTVALFHRVHSIYHILASPKLPIGRSGGGVTVR
jgi:hypothetical protein